MALTPTDLTHQVRLHIEQRFNEVWLTGELSNFRRPGSGHWYFSLKDESAQVRCAMFVNRNRFAKLQPKDGSQVLLRGRVTLYEARGDFQVIVEHIEPAGDGALRLAFDALLKKLHQEGLTAEARKRALPDFPRRVVVVTSASGAALQDVLAVWHRRFPALEVLVLDAAVQGSQAESQLVRAIQRAPEYDPDLLLLCRGGGSLEDLWAFNLESVARAVVDCPVPVVSAIGHEVDVSITDYVADLRAATPTAAAELCTPDAKALLDAAAKQFAALVRTTNYRLERKRSDLERVSARLRDPSMQLAQWMQRMDDLAHRAGLAVQQRLANGRLSLSHLERQLAQVHPDHAIRDAKRDLGLLAGRLTKAMDEQLGNQRTQTQQLSRTLAAVSPLNTLARGYVIVTDQHGTVVPRVADVSADDRITANFADGAATLTVDETQTGGGLASHVVEETPAS